MPRMSAAKKRDLLKFAISAGVAGGYLIVQGPLINAYRNYKVACSLSGVINGMPGQGIKTDRAEIGPELQKLIDETLVDMSAIPDSKKKKIEFVPIDTTKPWSLGSMRYHFKAVVGVPDYFNITSARELKAYKLNYLLYKDATWKMRDDEKWSTGPGKMLIDSFLLSDAAKKYLIARQIGMTDSLVIYQSALLIFLSLCLHYVMEGAFLGRFPVPVTDIPWRQKFPYTLMSAAIAVALYMMIRIFVLDNGAQRDGDALALTRGYSNSKDLIEESLKGLHQNMLINEEYYRGAIEYYTKVQERNIALRLLMKEEAPFYNFAYGKYTAEGDEKSGIISPEIPISGRLENIRRWRQGLPRERNRFQETMGISKPPSFEPDSTEADVKKSIEANILKGLKDSRS